MHEIKYERMLKLKHQTFRKKDIRFKVCNDISIIKSNIFIKSSIV